jgi:hypothetical protein
MTGRVLGSVGGQPTMKLTHQRSEDIDMVRIHYWQPVVVLFIGGLIAFNLLAQDQVIPIRNWPAPLYWQPPLSEEEKAAKAAEPEPRLAGPITPPLVFVGLTPCRVMDTRVGQGQTGAFGPPTMSGGSSRTVPIPTHPTCAVPGTAKAYSFNVTVVPQGPLGFLTIWPTGSAQPLVSTLNAPDGNVTANAAIVPAGTSGSVNIYVTNTTDVIVDINGYYMAPSALALGAGTAGAPSLTFSNDANSGVYSPSAGTVTVTAAGTNRLSVSSTGISVAGNVDLTGDLTKSGQALLRANALDTAVGLGAGYSGTGNTALGAGVLAAVNASSLANTAVGYYAGNKLTSPYSNVAIGYEALTNTTTGGYNTAIGTGALSTNISGSDNTALGLAALINTTGIYNIGLGDWAGGNLTTGSYNIDISNQGVAGESNTIRIGDNNQNRTFISGIRGITTGVANAIPVLIDSLGQLGTVSSSRRVKRDIRDMGDTTETIMGLHPVRFRFKAHGPDGPEQYGLVAEEVLEVAPELVARNKDGEIETVFYDKVNAMLLNEVQKQHRLFASQKSELQTQQQLIRELESRLAEVESRAK